VALLSRGVFGRKAPAPSPVEDEAGQALVQRWRRGDQSAFTDLFRAYRQLVYGVLFHLLPNDPDLEDVVQTAFVEIFRSLESFEGRARLSSWIARVALNVGYHHIRHRKSRPTDYAAERRQVDVVDTRPSADPEGQAEQRDLARRVHAILEGMAPRKRTVFLLNDLQGLPQEQVAEIVGANIATVRTRLFYARRDFWKKAKEDPVLAAFAPGSEK
jgi:RNA polymerase sigma-70 factor (ECF subfamily)